MKNVPILILSALGILCLLCGCKQVQYIPLETVKLDSIYIAQTQRDSIVRYDSIYVRDKGDTLYVERWKYLYRDKLRVDTVSVLRVDSVQVPVPVEKALTKWQQFKLDVGGYALCVGVVLVLVLVVVGYLVYKLKKH